MGIDMQLAGIWKRMAAWLLDIILLAVLAVGAAYLLSAIFRYDAASDALQAHYDRYEQEYGEDVFQKTPDEMTDEERVLYDQMNQKMHSDKDLLEAYNKVINLTMLMISLSILMATVVLEFVVPLLLKNGQTVGKKCFGIGLIRNDGVRMNTLQLFTRSILGKYTIGTMIPAYIILLVFFGSLGVLGTVILGLMAIGQIVCIGITRNNCALHDLMAGTVAVDLASQKVFENSDELLAYIKQLHAERAKREEY